MLDIHTHIIPFTDDGSDSFQASVELIREEIANGVTTIIATPHYCPNRGYKLSKEELINKYNDFVYKVKEQNLDIEILLGQEIYCSDFDKIPDKISSGELLTINNSKFVLLEFSTEEMPKTLFDLVYTLKIRGFKPIIAHIERYKWMTVDIALSLKNEGCFIQVNSSSFFNFKKRILCNKLLKKGIIDFVASDIHCGRKNTLSKVVKLIGGDTIVNKNLSLADFSE